MQREVVRVEYYMFELHFQGIKIIHQRGKQQLDSGARKLLVAKFPKGPLSLN